MNWFRKNAFEVVLGFAVVAYLGYSTTQDSCPLCAASSAMLAWAESAPHPITFSALTPEARAAIAQDLAADPDAVLHFTGPIERTDAAQAWAATHFPEIPLQIRH